MRITKYLFGCLLVFCLASTGLAQETMEPPQPTAAHAKLDFWVGEWTGRGEMQPGPFGPGGPVEWTESCRWFGGNEFHVVCKSEGNGPQGEMKGLGIIGYDPQKEVYTHYGVDSTGWAGHSTGALDGETWTFKSKEKMGDKVWHTRFWMKKISPTKMDFAWEVSEDGETWNAMMTGTTEKTR